jgi:glycosyltransferase involved in cell wall biosynthesis
MLVSVCIICYNQEHYISRALDSVLSQKGNYDLEIVVGDDCSTDQTRNILLAYQEKHPHTFTLILRDKNIGVFRNFTDSILSCNGSYVALLEGDDYWISEDKLQKQLVFMEENPDFSFCFHDYMLVNGSGEVLEEARTLPMLKHYYQEDLFEAGWIAKTATLFFRNHLIRDFPDWFFEIRSGADFSLQLLLSQHGPAGYIPEKMSVYRRHEAGYSNSFRKREHLEMKIFRDKSYKKLFEKRNARIRKALNKRISGHYFQMNTQMRGETGCLLKRLPVIYYSIRFAPPKSAYEIKRYIKMMLVL